ncbi:hypothetical protein ABZV34_24965 [Streptomyces sp. NPDC005195]|uniref:hypothetical protein n=1 Tax=Streptomyces sp. NPDC005195 TaxID=3154561 RepID=UPI0033ABBD6B
MSVTVDKTSQGNAEVSWDPQEDDPHGYLARSIETDQLAYALEAVGSAVEYTDADTALEAARHTTTLARLLERRSAAQVVQLHDVHRLSWRRIAEVLFEDPEKQSSVRRMYDSGRRTAGLPS